MARDRQLTFVKKWVQRGVKTTDPFDKFFTLWLALVVAAEHFKTNHAEPFREKDTDREKALAYFQAKSDRVCEALEDNNETMVKLSGRHGTSHGNAIIDTGSPELRSKFSKLASHYKQGPILPPSELAETMAELLNKIRNNLFHGEKMYDDKEDPALLELVNPVLTDILRRCLSLEKGADLHGRGGATISFGRK